jgi:hypothetical protein
MPRTGLRTPREQDGTTIWTSPTGHVYRVPPATYPIDNTMKIKKDTPEATPAEDASSDDRTNEAA